VTTTQDYTLFNIFNDVSIDLWKKQVNLIMEKHGLISFIVHPDYVRGSRERIAVYETLLAYLADLRRQKGIWIATPGEVDRWWRQRAEMKLVKEDLGWRIEGPGSERAHLAYASQKDGRIFYTPSSISAELGRNSANSPILDLKRFYTSRSASSRLPLDTSTMSVPEQIPQTKSASRE
jgi:hypothetical protein